MSLLRVCRRDFSGLAYLDDMPVCACVRANHSLMVDLITMEPHYACLQLPALVLSSCRPFKVIDSFDDIVLKASERTPM